MMGKGPIWTRRRLLIGAASAGAATVIAPYMSSASGLDTIMPDGPGWAAGGAIKYRIDGFAKVTGAKIYARDLRGRDMDGWPVETHHAMLLFASDARHAFDGLDLSMLGESGQPDRIVLAEDLAAAGLAAEGFFASNLLCARGAIPDYLGQPVALLIYADFGRFTVARTALTGEARAVKRGAEGPARSTNPYGAGRYTRVASQSPMGPDVFSVMLAGDVEPTGYDGEHLPVWSTPDPNGDAGAKAAFHGSAIRKSLADGTAGKAYRQSFLTQSIDPMFMEPESGIAWFDAASGKLSVAIGVQSPDLSLSGISGMAKNATDGFKLTEVDGTFMFMGGSFGGKDHTIIPLYVALAGMFGGGKTVRLALNRFEQFQFGLKRHSFRIDSQLGVDPQTGRFTAFTCDLNADGGGLKNLSSPIASLAAVGSASAWYTPQSDVTTVVRQSIAVAAGSMRGFGSLESMIGMEVLVDQVAHDMGRDPITLRRDNTLQSGWLTLVGNTPNGAVRTGDVLDALEKSALWANRAADKVTYEAANPGFSYGVGVACVMQTYGSGVDGSMGSVSLAADGAIGASSGITEMGTGVGTAVAARIADHLGHPATTVQTLTAGLWDALKLEPENDPWGISQADQEKAAQNPRWTLAGTVDTTASNGAAFGTHAPAIAAWVILRCGLWPAAKSIWSEGSFGGQAAGDFLTFADLRWVDGKLTARGMTPLAIEELAARAHRDGLVTGAMAHASNRWDWATAEFSVDGDSFEVAIDALAVQRGGSATWDLLDRKNAKFPSTAAKGVGRNSWALLSRSEVNLPPVSTERVGAGYFSCSGAVVAVGVDRISSETRVVGVHQAIECGRALVPDIIRGMVEGGIVMGLGQALTEYLPLYEDGPGDGTWNLNSYQVLMSGDIPIDRITVDILAPLGPTDLPKGLGELSMILVILACLTRSTMRWVRGC